MESRQVERRFHGLLAAEHQSSDLDALTGMACVRRAGILEGNVWTVCGPSVSLRGVGEVLIRTGTYAWQRMSPSRTSS